MELVSKKINQNEIAIDFLGDFHIGNKGFDKRSLEKHIEVMKEDKVYYILMGDLFDCITPKDKRFELTETDSQLVMINNAYSYLKDLFSPISSRCLGILCGNHYLRWMQQTIFDYKKLLCKEFHTNYLAISAIIRLKTNSRKLDIHVTHGFGGGRTIGAIYNRLYSQIPKFSADVFAMGHSHKLGDTVVPIIYRKGNTVAAKYVWLLDSGCFLKIYQKNIMTWGEEKQFIPNVIGCMRLIINGKNRLWTEKHLY